MLARHNARAGAKEENGAERVELESEKRNRNFEA